MRAIMKSVSPRICEKVANGDCTILVSKTAPKCEVPFKGYICCTSAKPYLYREANPPFELFLDSELYKGKGYDDRLFSGKVIGDFICDEIIEWQYDSGHQYYVDYPDDCTSYFPYLKCHSEATGLKCSEIEKLGKGKPLYGWHISDLKIYGKPKALVEFYKCGAESFEELSDTEDLCSYCSRTGSCEGRWCDEAYQNYLDVDFALTRAPQGWCYVEEL